LADLDTMVGTLGEQVAANANVTAALALRVAGLETSSAKKALKTLAAAVESPRPATAVVVRLPILAVVAARPHQVVVTENATRPKRTEGVDVENKAIYSSLKCALQGAVGGFLERAVPCRAGGRCPCSCAPGCLWLVVNLKLVACGYRACALGFGICPG
jgi:hypothetical protein